MERHGWSPNLYTGIPKIDRKYRQIAALVADLESVDNPADQSRLLKLIDCIKEHFSSLFQIETTLPADDDRFSENHRFEHQRLFAELQAFHSTNSELCAKLARYLRVWLTTHAVVYDRLHGGASSAQQEVGGNDS